MMSQPSLPLFNNDHFVKGTLGREIFHNEETLYSVLLIDVLEASSSIDEAVIVGTLPRLHPDEVCTFYGMWKEHAKYGRQFIVQRYEKSLPNTPEGVIRYLSSGLFKGIGKKTAESIVRHLGTDALVLIGQDPDVLHSIPGITKARAKTIASSLVEHRDMEQAFVFLYNYDISSSLAAKIYHVYRHDTLSVLQSNPYRLIEDVYGIGFKRADTIGRAIGMQSDAPERIRAAVLFSLQESSQNAGHVFLPRAELLKSVHQLLSGNEEGLPFNDDAVEAEFERMKEEEAIIADDDFIYLPSLYWAEYGLAGKFHSLMNQKVKQYPFFEIYAVMGNLEEKFKVTYAPEQREAIETALHSPIMILTGGPGTGKTTVIRGICNLFAELNQWSLKDEDYNETKPFPIRLVAPTGRAAKRMTETTGLPASTIHRLLGWHGESFIHDSDNPINGKLLIIDETSMLDIWLANQLFRAIPKGMQIILVGDPDQLPSVGPGLVLQDLLELGKVPVISLNEVFRQEEGSSIISLAHEIRNGQVSPSLEHPVHDRRFYRCTVEQTSSLVSQICKQSLNRGLTKSDIQVLAPMYSGEAGVDRLNEVLQEVFNPLKPNQAVLVHRGVPFRVGDKVLQLTNQPDKNIYNGDIGFVHAVTRDENNDDCLIVDFDDNLVTYLKADLNQLTLAYATTIHKAQGSEFKVVIMPVVPSYARMLQRNLLYTGITRAKEYLLLCGDPGLFRRICRNQQPVFRYSRLRERYLQIENENEAY